MQELAGAPSFEAKESGDAVKAAPDATCDSDGFRLSCDALSFTVHRHERNLYKRYCRGKRRKALLHQVSFACAPGECVGILGPSGSGKTTLLSILAGHRYQGAWLEGKIVVDGQDLQDFVGEGRSCFIPQDDVLLGGLTPRESLRFAASLKLDEPEEARRAKVESVLAQLQLAECAETRIGGVEQKGISGGQRRRLSIGLELLTDPSLVLVDEATSGLDSKMAEDVMEILFTMARRQQRTVICSIHQPSFRIFSRFHKVLLLAQGRALYFGDTGGAQAFFAGMAMGLDLGPRDNPADVYMRWLQDPAVLAALLRQIGVDAGGASADEYDRLEMGESPADRLVQGEGGAAWSWVPSGFRYMKIGGGGGVFGSLGDSGGPAPAAGGAAWARDALTKMRGFLVAPQGPEREFATGRGRQTAVLIVRELYDHLKDPEKTLQSVLAKATVGFVAGVVWVNQAGDTQDAIYPVRSALFVVCINHVLDTVVCTALAMPRSKPLLAREHRNGYYSLPAYTTALILVNCAVAAANTVAFSLPCVYLIGLRSDPAGFFTFLAASTLLTWIAVSAGVGLGAFTETYSQAQAAIAPTILPLILFSGYLVPLRQLPAVFRPFYHLSFFQYGMSIMEANEFRGVTFQDCDRASFGNGTAASLSPSLTCFETGEELLHHNSVQVGDMPLDFLVLCLTWAAVSVLAHYAIASSVRRYA